MTPELISVVIPTYNVARFLSDFLTSLERQTYPLSRVDLVFVNDGSTDDSEAIIKDWIGTSAPEARLVSKENGGLSSARNEGLAHARGGWVTFSDPDDILDEHYFENVARFIDSRAASKVQLVVGNVLIHDDGTHETRNTHPLRFRFKRGNQVIDLDRHPDYLHLQAASAFYRRSRIEAAGLRFDERVKPNFEDAHFTGLYLWGNPAPRVAFLADAQYLYRHRGDGSSLVQGSWQRREKYTDLLRYGYLPLLEELELRFGSVPTWAQNLILYDLFYYFREDERIHARTGVLQEELSDEFYGLVRETLAYVDTETIYAFKVVPHSLQLRSALAMGIKGAYPRPDRLNIVRIDADKQIALVRYYYTGELPQEEFRGRGFRIEPIHAKIRNISYLGRTLLYERIVWLPATGTIQVSLDGRLMPLEMGRPVVPDFALSPSRMWGTLTNRSVPSDANASAAQSHHDNRKAVGPGNQRQRSLPAQAQQAQSVPDSAPQQDQEPVTEGPSKPGQRVTDSLQGLQRTMSLGATQTRRLTNKLARLQRSLQGRTTGAPVSASSREAVSTSTTTETSLRERAASRQVRARYASAWVFIDRDIQAQDNAEHLYRFVMTNHPDINAWFVLDRQSPDWDRLAAEGFRLVAHRTDEHVLLMLNCAHLISSQVDHYIVQPYDQSKHGRNSWRFTFLQHGVTKDDLSRWINGKPISLLVCASEDEHRSISGDHTPYIFTTKETKLTGFARHDRLWRLQSTAATEPFRLLIMPTWRRTLLGGELGDSNRRALLDDFEESQYAREWLGLLRSEELKQRAAASGLKITFMPHPNMQDYLDVIKLPDYIDVFRYKDVDIQEILVQGALMITDYSSLAFEMAYIERPVVYFQFDADSFFGGGHAYRKGDWDYQKNGFGPVRDERSHVLSEVDSLIKQDLHTTDEYMTRMIDAFPYRDGRCCERTVTEITRLTQPLSYAEAYHKTKR